MDWTIGWYEGRNFPYALRTLAEFRHKAGPYDRGLPAARSPDNHHETVLLDGVHEVMRTGKPVYMSKIPLALLEESARDEEHRRIYRELNLTSYMCVPLTVQGQPIGAITFVSAESGREYSEGDVRFARELASRASLAIENARAYERANEATRLRDEFLATLSHELRTPLNAVLGYARMMRTQAVPQEKAQTVWDIVERNATALKQIIEDVLDVSRIVAGRLRLNVEPVDLPAILREALGTVLPAAEAKGVRVETVIDQISVPVSGHGVATSRHSR